MATMKALVYKEDGIVKLDDKPIPTLQRSTDAVVKLIYTTICGTDMHIIKGNVRTCLPGTTLGHEGVGVIHEVGEGVHRFKKGDRVLINCITSCTTCKYCRRSMLGRCIRGGWQLGHTIDGTQAEYVRIPFADAGLHRVPPGVDEKHLIMFSDIIPTAFECGVLNGKVQTGSSVAVVGAGLVGLSGIIVAKLSSPSTIVAIDKDKKRLEVAKALGANHVVSPDEMSAADIVEKYGQGVGFDTVMEAVGLPVTFEMCQELVAPGGTLANIGVHLEKCTVHMEKLWIMNMAITMGLVDTHTTPKLIDLYAKGVIPDEKLGMLFTHDFDFKKMEDAYSIFSASHANEALKILIKM